MHGGGGGNIHILTFTDRKTINLKRNQQCRTWVYKYVLPIMELAKQTKTSKSVFLYLRNLLHYVWYKVYVFYSCIFISYLAWVQWQLPVVLLLLYLLNPHSEKQYNQYLNCERFYLSPVLLGFFKDSTVSTRIHWEIVLSRCINKNMTKRTQPKTPL